MMMVIRVSIPARKKTKLHPWRVVALDDEGRGFQLKILSAYIDDKKQTPVKIRKAN